MSKDTEFLGKEGRLVYRSGEPVPQPYFAVSIDRGEYLCISVTELGKLLKEYCVVQGIDFEIYRTGDEE